MLNEYFLLHQWFPTAMQEDYVIIWFVLSFTLQKGKDVRKCGYSKSQVRNNVEENDTAKYVRNNIQEKQLIDLDNYMESDRKILRGDRLTKYLCIDTF